MGNNAYAYAHVLAHLCMLQGLGKQWETMDLVTFGLESTTGTGSGNNGKQYICICTCSGAPMHARRARETMGNHGFGNFLAGNHHWHTLGKQRDATGGNGFGNFRAGNHHWGTLGRQREVMDLATFELGITTGIRLGGNGRQRIC